jgi:hypothetical protein
MFTGYSACDAKANTDRAPNGLGFHSDSDGNSHPQAPTCTALLDPGQTHLDFESQL